MTSIDITIQKIKKELISTFALLDECFDSHQAVLFQKPSEGRWSIGEILEHVMLTNKHLLMLINRASAKALRKAERENLNDALIHYRFDLPELDAVGVPQSFPWQRPPHMEPHGQTTPDEIQSELRWQLYICLHHLTALRNGEGILHRTTMTVNNLGKLDVYQYIFFLALHGQRHLRQIEKNLIGYDRGH